LNKSKELAEEEEGEKFTKWSLVVQDCFSGGSVPGEMFTVEFWRDLSELVERDGIVAMVCPSFLWIDGGLMIELCRIKRKSSI
jgi:spermidine synthase